MMLQDPDYDHLTCGVVFILVVLLWLQVCCLMFNSTYLKENLQDHELDDDNKQDDNFDDNNDDDDDDDDDTSTLAILNESLCAVGR